MSYLDGTVLNDFQAKEAQNEKFDANYGMVDLTKDSTAFVDYVSPSVREKLNTISSARDAVLPVMKDQTVTVTTTPGFSNIPINLGESDTYFFTAYDVFSGFRQYPSTYENNQIDGDWWVEQTLRNVLKAMAVAKDDIIETVLEARKTQQLSFGTQVSQGDGTFTFSTSTDILTINKAAQKDTMFTNLEALMEANQVGGRYRMVLTPGGFVVSETEAFKFQTDQTKQLLWAQSAMPPDRRYITNQISPASDNFKGFLVRDGAIGIFENFPWDFRNGTAFAGQEWGITDVEMPFTRSRMNFYTNNEATDATAVLTTADTNNKMTHFKEMALWDRFYIVYRYNSAIGTRVNDIVKLVGATS